MKSAHCPNGHELTPENTRKSYPGRKRGSECKTCYEEYRDGYDTEYMKKYNALHRERLRAYAKEWRTANAGKVTEYKQNLDPEKSRENTRRYRAKKRAELIEGARTV